MRDGVVHGVVAEDGLHQADAVICATTATTALGIIPNLPVDVGDALVQATYSSACHVVLGIEVHPLPIGDATVAAPLSAPAGKGLIHAYYPEEYADELLPL